MATNFTTRVIGPGTAAVALVVATLSGCSSPGAPRGAAGSPGAATADSSPSTSRPTGSSGTRAGPATTKVPATTSPPTPTTVVASLPAPAAIPPLALPALPGEGAWTAAGDRQAGGYALYTTQLRPAAGHREVGAAWIDTKVTRLELYAGSGEPTGTWPHQTQVEAASRPALLAAFNAGFRVYNYRTGWYEDGVSAEPLQTGAASLAILADGRATVGQWGRDIGPATGAVAVRQNLTLLVDHGSVVPSATDPAAWGAVLGGGPVTWRSGVGVTSAGDLLYVGGPDLTPALLAAVLVAAGAVRAMEMDINPEWVSFVSYQHPDGVGTASLTGRGLLAGMWFGPDHYLTSDPRDFFAVFSAR